MRLCTFEVPRKVGHRAGLVEGPEVFEIRGHGSVASIVASGAGPRGLQKGGRHMLDEVRLAAPVPRPGKIVAAIVNTQAMLGGGDVHLDWPRLDMKAPSTVVGQGVRIEAPPGGVRPEVELAVVVGKRLSKATEAEAASAIFGYTILNDVTAPADSRADAYEAYRRDRASGAIRKATMRGPLFRSKNHDGFCPMGPWVVTPDEMGSVADLRMTTRFDGELVQEGSTSEYLFPPAAIASYVSGFLALEPGDVVSCGSVGWTREALKDLDPTEYLLPDRPGLLELEVELIGKLANPVSARGDR